ncbi:MAG: MBL fold metallo-hydrolase RNA specificity domain-containing protein [Lautropia sp.]
MKITFHGAAREVTGSCYLIEAGDARFLVDCGMVQGGRDAPVRNRRPFGFDARTLDFVLLTHAHIDHSGLLPKLLRAGFEGPIYTTAATADLLAVMLPDSAHIQVADAQWRARHRRRPPDAHADPDTSPRKAAGEGAGHRSHRASSIPPLYTVEDANACLGLLSPVAYDEAIRPHPAVRCVFRDAGHILGSAILEIDLSEAGRTLRLVMSGDLGQPGRPILRDPAVIDGADVLVIESTYGDRAHKDTNATLDELVGIVDDTFRVRHGNVIVPAFAVGRTQEILYHLHHLTSIGRLPRIDIFVDSPMATAATAITARHFALFDEEAKALADWHAKGVGLPSLRFVSSVEESMALNQIRSGALIISASGMCNAGRVKHHLRQNLGRRECAVLITGFQAAGTLGRRLVDGAKRVGIFGDEIAVRASIHTLGGFSAHADQPALLAWAGAIRRRPQRTFVVHGEAQAASALADRLRATIGGSVVVPEAGYAEIL